MRFPARKSPLRHLVWIIPLLALDFFLFRWLASARAVAICPRRLRPSPRKPSNRRPRRRPSGSG